MVLRHLCVTENLGMKENSRKSGHPLRFRRPIGVRIQWLGAKFPTQRNREFPHTYQGKFFKEQGIFHRNASDRILTAATAVSPPRIAVRRRGSALLHKASRAKVRYNEACVPERLLPLRATLQTAVNRADLAVIWEMSAHIALSLDTAFFTPSDRCRMFRRRAGVPIALFYGRGLILRRSSAHSKRRDHAIPSFEGDSG